MESVHDKHSNEGHGSYVEYSSQTTIVLNSKYTQPDTWNPSEAGLKVGAGTTNLSLMGNLFKHRTTFNRTEKALVEKG